MLCCLRLEILNNFLQSGPAFSFCSWPHKLCSQSCLAGPRIWPQPPLTSPPSALLFLHWAPATLACFLSLAHAKKLGQSIRLSLETAWGLVHPLIVSLALRILPSSAQHQNNDDVLGGVCKERDGRAQKGALALPATLPRGQKGDKVLLGTPAFWSLLVAKRKCVPNIDLGIEQSGYQWFLEGLEERIGETSGANKKTRWNSLSCSQIDFKIH